MPWVGGERRIFAHPWTSPSTPLLKQPLVGSLTFAKGKLSIINERAQPLASLVGEVGSHCIVALYMYEAD